MFSDSWVWGLAKMDCRRKGRKGRWRVAVGVCGVKGDEEGTSKRGVGAKCGVVRFGVV